MFPCYYPRLPHTGKKIHLQAQNDLLPLLFAFNHQDYTWCLTKHHLALTDLSIAKPQAFSDLKTFSLGASLSGYKFSSIRGDLVNEVTINREIKVRGGPMRGGYSISIDAHNDFIVNSHILSKLRKELKNKMNLKTDLNHKKSIPGEFKKHKEQIAGPIGNLKDYGNPFHGAVQNRAAGAEIPGNIANWLLFARKYGAERVDQFIEKRLLSQEVSFLIPYIATLLKKKKQRKVMSVLKENRQAGEIHWEARDIQVSFNNLHISSLCTWREIVSTKS